MTRELGRECSSKVPVSADCNGFTQRAEGVEVDEVDKLKVKLISAWNNVKHGWVVKTKTNFNRHSPICLLSRKYECFPKDGAAKPGGGAPRGPVIATPGRNVGGSDDGRGGAALPAACADFAAFRRDFATRVWITYRREFPQLEGSSLTTDTGWGCMLRSGQMLLAQGLLQHLLGRDWQCREALRRLESENESLKKSQSRPGDSNFVMVGAEHVGSDVYSEPASILFSSDDQEAVLAEVALHRRIIHWFADTPDAPFGVHNLVRLGRSSNKRAGDWYGPAITAHILKKAIAEVKEKVLHRTVMYVAQDCTVYKGDIMDLCQTEAGGRAVSHSQQTGPGWESELIVGGNPRGAGHTEPGGGWRSVFILIPVRLGGEHFNPVYVACVKGMLEMDSCIGIIGGKPKHSLYFVGYQDDDIIYLDPHYCQPTVDFTRTDFPVETYHCCPPRKTAFTTMDPSCTLGFYCRTKEDFIAFSSTVTQAFAPSSGSASVPSPSAVHRDVSPIDGLIAASAPLSANPPPPPAPAKVLATPSRAGGARQESYPVFSFVDGRGRDHVAEEPRRERRVRPRSVSPAGAGAVRRGSVEDFVLL